MNIEIELTKGPIPTVIPQQPPQACGAWAEFRGFVRDQENGERIVALEYEAYSPMAESQMRRILEDISSRHACVWARVIHRTGVVAVGEAAIYVGIAGKRRAEVFALLAEFMDRLKQDVPIWKTRALAALESDTDGMASSASRGMHSAAEVIRLVQERCSPLEGEPAPLSDALGRVLRQAVIAPEPQPAFDRSGVDGYAVRVDDQRSRFQVVDEIRAGEWKPRALRIGEAVRIATGGAMPSHGLQVIMKEDVRVENGTVALLGRDSTANIRFRGEDARAGQELVSSGTVLQPGTLALLASVGCVQPLVTRLPRVLHISTGNEIVGAEQEPALGQIRDSNSILVRAFLKQWGIAPEQERVGEDEEAIWRTLEDRTGRVDLLLVSGGASVGEHDFTRRLLERAGFDIRVSRTNARPGKPLIIAQRGRNLAFGLPGNPLAQFVCLNLYVRTALEAWSGQTSRSGFGKGILKDDLEPGATKRETFWPAYCQIRDGRPEASPLRWSSSGDLTALCSANALIHVARGKQKLPSGSEIEFISTLRNFG
jgi:molybdopterin molybdotransferase